MSDRSQSVSGSNNVDSLRLFCARESVRPTCGRARPPTAHRETGPVARRPGVALRPTALRADVYAGTERPVEIHREPVTQRDLLSTVCEQRCIARRASSVAATHNGVKNIFEIHFSLRRRREQRLSFSQIPRCANRAKESERAPQLCIGFGTTPPADE